MRDPEQCSQPDGIAVDDKGWHPGRESGFQLFSKLLQEKTLLDSVVTIGTQKNITNNCCKTESPWGLTMPLFTRVPLQAPTAAMGWVYNEAAGKVNCIFIIKFRQSVEGTYLGTSQCF